MKTKPHRRAITGFLRRNVLRGSEPGLVAGFVKLFQVGLTTWSWADDFYCTTVAKQF